MKKYAFTLAEVLITLGIIGVVAALTMPSLIAKHKEKETVVKVKKVYSVFSNAYLLAANEDGTPDNWGLTGLDQGAAAQVVLDKFAPYLKLQKNCGRYIRGCFPDVIYKYLNGSNFYNSNFNTSPTYAKAIMADGIIFRLAGDGACNTANTLCAVLMVDTNGFKPPNQFGKDFFIFHVRTNGIAPINTPDQDPNLADCKNSGVCTAWIIINENMDYLHCKDLSWSGKTKCK
ncbi:MAG: type II secretion system GspH family protein [Heliobacteriaceae bacterium]|jgi:prepilin-type N-terminal cleavage/methylation domain-containing protein|nr:type II secretion system GspH family protein [Heliobacteriaceae bacterium]